MLDVILRQNVWCGEEILPSWQYCQRAVCRIFRNPVWKLLRRNSWVSWKNGWVPEFCTFFVQPVGETHTREWVMLLCAVGVLVMGAVKRCTSFTDRSEDSPKCVRVFESDLDAFRYTVSRCDYRSILRNKWVPWQSAWKAAILPVVVNEMTFTLVPRNGTACANGSTHCDDAAIRTVGTYCNAAIRTVGTYCNAAIRTVGTYYDTHCQYIL